MKHIIAILIFLPITIVFVVSILLEMIWLMLHAFHYEAYQQEFPFIELPFELQYILSKHPKLYNVIFFLLLILSPIEGFFTRLKQIKEYKF